MSSARSDDSAHANGEGRAALADAVRASVALVCDPEYPDVTISELGILEDVSVSGSTVRIGLVPTMLGCPALDVIARDVAAAARAACNDSGREFDDADPDNPRFGDMTIDVVFLADPVWTPERIAPSAVGFLAREYSIAVRIRSSVSCPVCASTSLEHRSDFGPTPCRSVEWCPQCRNPVEVVGRPVAGSPATGHPAAGSPEQRLLA